MENLNDLEQIKKYDPKDVFGSTGYLADQLTQIHDLIENIQFDSSLSQVKNVVISGMGGSAYGGQVAQYLLKQDLKVPLMVNNDYTLPAFVNQETLVILTSYSGSTEETLASMMEAQSKGAKIIGLTSGGKLAEKLKSTNSQVVEFDPKFNPSGQPRLGTGYIVLGTIEILRKLNLISLTSDQIIQSIDNLKKISSSVQDQAKNLVQQIYGSIPVIFAADFLVGNAHIIRNQFNETSKSFSAYSPLPELNHHLMEGLKNPPDKRLTVIFLESELYPQVIKKRLNLTKDVVEKNTIKHISFKLTGLDKLSQSFECLLFGSYLTFYLAILYEQDPSIIPWVDYFKQQLAQN